MRPAINGGETAPKKKTFHAGTLFNSLENESLQRIEHLPHPNSILMNM